MTSLPPHLLFHSMLILTYFNHQYNCIQNYEEYDEVCEERTLKDPSSPQRKRWPPTEAHFKLAHQSSAMRNPFFMTRLYGEAHKLGLIS